MVRVICAVPRYVHSRSKDSRAKMPVLYPLHSQARETTSGNFKGLALRPQRRGVVEPNSAMGRRSRNALTRRLNGYDSAATAPRVRPVPVGVAKRYHNPASDSLEGASRSTPRVDRG